MNQYDQTDVSNFLKVTTQVILQHLHSTYHINFNNFQIA